MRKENLRKNRKQGNKYIDPNELKNGDDPNVYFKELAGLAAILGTGIGGPAIFLNDRVYAAKNSVDPKSQIVGSVSTSTQIDANNKINSKSKGKEVSISNSEAQSISNFNSRSLLISQSTSSSLKESLSRSQSTSTSLKQSLSYSQSTSELHSLNNSHVKKASLGSEKRKVSQSHLRDSKSLSNHEKTSETVSSISHDNNNTNLEKTNYTRVSSNTILEKQNSINNVNSLSLSNGQIIEMVPQIPVVFNKNTTDSKSQSINKLNLNNVFASVDQANTGVNENTAEVSNGTEFQTALNNSNISLIRLTDNIDLGQSGMGDLLIPPRNLTIEGKGHDLNLGDNCIWLNNWLNDSTSSKTTTIVKSLNLYTANERGGFALTGSGAETLIYDNVHATGGAAVMADTFAPSGYLKTFEVQGHTTIDGVSSYQYNGNTYYTSSANFVGYGTLIYAGNDLIVDDDASLIINNSMSPYDVAMLANDGEHAVEVGKNATLEINNTYSGYSGGQIWNNVGNIALTNSNGRFIAGENSYINLSTSGANIYFASGSSNNIVTFNSGTATKFSGNQNIYFGGSENVVNIDDPDYVVLNTSSGTTYATDSNAVVNATNTNVIVTNDGITRESNYFTNNQSSVNGTTYSVGTTIGEQNNGKASVASVMNDINKNGTTQVEYMSGSKHSESISYSISTSESVSTSFVESISRSTSQSLSRSGSKSLSESLSNSVSQSEILSNSVSMSESLSNSVSMSDSLSNSVSMSESLSNSVSMSDSLSNSVSMSESLSNSVSMSESLSNSVSMSESLSNSVSMSESLSNSVSMSDSLSNSVSMSESLSNSVSMSESLSNSVSMSDSLSNSVSMSDS
uniref:pectate lyase-like adhesive domain-containing protein n=1 Tax=Lactobacillus taiwanensis TaxID=508451 RepID=UPI0032E3AD6E